MPFAPGMQLGPYRILDHIGAGGMGEVYRVQDTRLGRELALKVLPQERTGDMERRQRFIQEARAASALNHPNIITIYDIGTEGGVDYIAMEYVDGKTLDQITPPRGFRFEQALKLAIPIADGLAKAHTAGIIHRDLKPSNVMVTEDGRVKLLDFGLAKLTEAVEGSDQEGTTTVVTGSPRTTEGMILGTASYMSPEQAEGKKVDARSDIFSFGAVLYEMVTGQRAFQSGSTISTLSSILKDEPEQISSIKAGVPAELQRVISRCLKKDPERRWHSMKDVKVALEELKEESDSGILAAQAGQGPERGPAARRAPWFWPAVAGGAVLVLVLAIFGLKAIGGRGSETPAAAPGGGPATPAVAAPSAPAGADQAAAASPSTPSESPLTNDQVIEMVKAGVSERLIMDHIHRSPTNFDLSTKEIIRLTRERVPETVIAMMRNPKATPAAVVAQLSRASQAPEPKKPAPAVAAAPPPPPAAPAPAEPAPPPPPEKFKLPDGAKVVLALSEQVDLTALREADRVAFTVAEDVKVGDVVLIAKGSYSGGTVVQSKRQRLFSKSRRVEIRLETVETVDRQRVKVVPSPGPTTASGDSGPVLSLAPGASGAANPATKTSIIPQGTEFVVQVVGDREVTVHHAGDANR